MAEDFYRITLYDGNSWKPRTSIFCSLQAGIDKARALYRTRVYSDVALELDNDTEPGSSEATIVWMARQDELSN